MNYEDWKIHESSGKVDKENFERHLEMLHFTIVKNHSKAFSRVVKGICYTPDCENPYKKSYQIIKSSGPYCIPCIRGSSLIKQSPDIAKSIVKCDVPVSQLCCKSDKKVTFQCQEQCLRCSTNHEFVMSVGSRVNGNKCSICTGHQKCPCQQENEFKCSKCKQIKNKSFSSYKNVCKLCDSQKHDDNIPQFISYLVNDCRYRGKRNPRKHGDLSKDYILNMYNVQEGRCYITNVPLKAGHHRNWKLSVDRIIDSCGYDNMNTVLIATEVQNGNRKWTRTLWDEVCSMVQGTLQYELPDEQEFIEQQVEKARKKTRKSGYNIQRHEERINEHGIREVLCKYCHEFLTLDKFQATKIGYCKECRKKIDHDTVENTLRGRSLVCITRSKMRSAKRRKDAVVHSVTLDDVLDIYAKQGGRCYYSNIPLAFTGDFQMSLERIDSTQGYTRENSVLIILPLNAGDWSIQRNEQDDREEKSGWTREKLLFAVKHNPREIVPEITYVKDIFISALD